MISQLPIDKTFLISIWLEALVYGFFLCLFCGCLYINLTLRSSQDGHSKTMFSIGIVMFIIATMHLGFNCSRLIRAYVDHATTPGGAAAFLGNLALWDHIFKDTLYATQEILGNAAAIYRCWVLWGHNWKIILLPTMMLIVSIVSGYTVCGLYTSFDPTATVFDPRLLRWITIFYSMAVAENIIVTGLMGWRIWAAEKRSAAYRTQKSNLIPVLRILVESAALQLFVEIILLSLYSANINAQYILLEIVTPLVGITFTAITIRITLRSKLKAVGTLSEETHVNTFGSVPMRRIAINVTKDIKDDTSAFHMKSEA